jgi:hypothetical protein
MLIADYIAMFGLVALIGAAAALSERKSLRSGKRRHTGGDQGL